MMWDPAAIMASMSDMSIRVVIILLITVATVRLLTRQPARVRYIVWATAMVGILLVPGLAKLLPDWHVGILPNDLPSVGQTSEPHIDTSPTVTATVPRQRLEHSASVVERVPATPSLWERARSIDWRPGLLGLWAAGTLVLALSLGRGLWRARGLRRRAAKLDHDGWPALLAECSEQIRIVREAELAESAEISAPMTWGFLYPIILLPSAARGWSSERRRLVLLHELAHIKRNDWIVHLVSRLACIVYWFNPLVWAGAGRLNIEREKACDDDVIATGAKPSAYAAHLLDIARSVTSSSNIPAATLTMARSNQLEGRLVSMLNDMPRKSGHRVWLPALMLTPVIVALASLQPWSSVPVPSAVAFPVATEHESAVVQSDSHSGRYRFSRNDKDDVLVFEQSIEDLDMRVRIEGDVHFNEAGTEITRMERGAVVYIEATEGRTDFELEITHDGESFQHDWRIDGRREEFDTDAETWMHTVLPIVHGHMKMAMLLGEHHSLQGEINSIHGKRNSLRGEINSIHGERNSLLGDINSVLGQQNALLGEINAIHGTRNALRGQINSINGERNALQGQINTLYGERNSVRSRYKGLEAQKRDLRREQRSLERRIRDDGGEASKHDKEMHMLLEKKIAELDHAQAELEKDLNGGEYETRVRELEDRLAATNLDERARELAVQIDDEAIEREVERVRMRLDELKIDEQVEKLRTRILELQVEDRVLTIQTEIEALMVEEKVRELESRIDVLNANEHIHAIEKALDSNYDKLKQQMRAMKSR